MTTTHLTLAQRLQEAGLSMVSAARHPRRAARLTMSDTPDGPIYGISYDCDFDGREEGGVRRLAQALCVGEYDQAAASSDQLDHIGFFSDVTGMVLSIDRLEQQELKWSQAVSESFPARSRPDHAVHWQHYMPYVQCVELPFDVLRHAGVKQLMTEARQRGIRPLPRTRDMLVAALVADMQRELDVDAPTQWPAWFGDGRHLVLRADTGAMQVAITHLQAAARSGSIVTGAAGLNPYGNSISFYDARDVSPHMMQDLREERLFREAALQASADVQAHLRSEFGYLALEPARDPERGTLYRVYGLRVYLNDQGAPGTYSRHNATTALSFAGDAYTLAELEDRSFITIAAARRSKT